MPIEKEILSKFTCCFLNDDHIAIEPILVSCGAIGCKECIRSSKTEEIECFSCKEKHKTNDLKNMPGVKAMEDMVKLLASDLFEYAKVNLEKVSNLLKGKIILYFSSRIPKAVIFYPLFTYNYGQFTVEIDDNLRDFT